MLKSRRHAVDFCFAETVPGGFFAPLRDGRADMSCYIAGLTVVQLKIPGNFKGKCEGGSVIVATLLRGTIDLDWNSGYEPQLIWLKSG